MKIDLRDHHEALNRALEVSLLFAEDDLTDLDKHTPEYAKGSEAAARASVMASVTGFRELATTARRQIDKLAATDQSKRR